jgi:hypothetical protein
VNGEDHGKFETKLTANRGSRKKETNFFIGGRMQNPEPFYRNTALFCKIFQKVCFSFFLSCEMMMV